MGQHATEKDSWASVAIASSAIFSRQALSSISLLPAIALESVLSAVTRRVVTGRWLHAVSMKQTPLEQPLPLQQNAAQIMSCMQ